MPEDTSVRELLRQLRAHDWEVRQEASRQLQSVSDPDALPLFLEAMDDDDLSVRVAAVNALSNYAPEQVDGALEKALFDDEWEVQWAAMRSLGQVHKESALRHLGDRLPDKRISGLQSLTKKKAIRWNKAIVASLDDESDDVRIASVRAIIELHLHDALEPLRRQLRHASPELKAWLAEALLHLGQPLHADDPNDPPPHLLPCDECEHLLPPSRLYRAATWTQDPRLLCQFHYEEWVEKMEPFESKFKRCKACQSHWPKYEFVDGLCPSCRRSRFDSLALVTDEDQFRCFRCHKTFPERSMSPASPDNEPLCSRCAYNVSNLAAKQPFLSNHAVHFLSEAFENGYFLCERSRHFYPLGEMAEGEDFRDQCVSKEYAKS